MRKLYCPACASPATWDRDGFGCSCGPSFTFKLGNQIKNSVYAVEPHDGAPRDPEIAPYLWCPNCTGALEDHDEKERRLECVQCGLKLPIVAHMELMEVRKEHVRRHERGELFNSDW